MAALAILVLGSGCSNRTPQWELRPVSVEVQYFEPARSQLHERKVWATELRLSSDRAVQLVSISGRERGPYISATEVSWRDWRIVAKESSLLCAFDAPKFMHPEADDGPVSGANLHLVNCFLKTLSKMSGHPVRLPTLQEYGQIDAACRDATATPVSEFLRAWMKYEALDGKYAAVSSGQRNCRGLFHLYGNAAEWSTEAGRYIAFGPSILDRPDLISKFPTSEPVDDYRVGWGTTGFRFVTEAR